jgi:ribonucleoside-diphosphate reductase alpha chain
LGKRHRRITIEINRFKTSFAENIFRNKYAQGTSDSWDQLAERLVEDVCGTRNGTLNPLMGDDDMKDLAYFIKTMKFLPGGRYRYYAGREFKAYNNCYLLRAEEDTREEWANVVWRAMSCLTTGGGIGVDYSALRPRGRTLKRTGGKASGPIPLMYAVNEVGRNVMQGGSRRSAIYASLNWQHEDIPEFLELVRTRGCTGCYLCRR